MYELIMYEPIKFCILGNSNAKKSFIIKNIVDISIGKFKVGIEIEQ